MSNIEDLLRNNRELAARITAQDPAFFPALARQQNPRYLWIGCSDSRVPANEIVSAVYSASNYSCGEWGAYECPECGTAHLGTEAAYRCCSQVEELQLACA